LHKAGVVPLAVVGVGRRRPGDVASPALPWQNLRRNGSPLAAVAPQRSTTDQYAGRALSIRSVCIQQTLLDDFAGFDPESFGMAEKDPSPQHRLLPDAFSKAMGDCPGPIAGSMAAPLTTVEGSQSRSGYLASRDLLKNLEGTWSE
jgi:acyl transferase domain-containing protein